MKRKTGIVIPLAALYDNECPAIGDFLALKKFADFAEKCSIKIIQLLPVNDSGSQSSPYSGLSAFALHPIYIRIEALPEFEDCLKNDRTFSSAYKKFQKKYKKTTKRFNYEQVLEDKTNLLHLLYAFIEKKISSGLPKAASESKMHTVTAKGMTYAQEFANETGLFAHNNPWVVEYAVYKDLKDSFSQSSWKEWPENFQKLSRKQIELRWQNRALKSSHNFFVWCQMRAASQFKEAADYVRQKGIILKGDIPILMNEDSCDTWSYPEYFNQELKAGSPPDGENPGGQNWGFPVYRWEEIEKDNFSWWKNRVRLASQYYDAFRIDHILGFFRIWASPVYETSAYLGHTEPFSGISLEEFSKKGFDEGRMNWLSKPHIPTKIVEDITGSREEAREILKKVAVQIGNEELWNFKKEIRGDKDLYSQNFCQDTEKDEKIRRELSLKWGDRCLLEIKDGIFHPIMCYKNSTSWKSLNQQEQAKLEELFSENEKKENELWKTQALKVLRPIVEETKMIPCAEDLGAGLESMPEVLKELNILSLRVIRWSRDWFTQDMPYIPLNSYPKLSVCTSSVHDSSTLRQWWNNEKDSVKSFIKAFPPDKNKEGSKENQEAITEEDVFTSKQAVYVLESAAKTSSAWYINPLQDFLYTKDSCYLENEDEERINVPGSVNDFNWTYRLPFSTEKLTEDSELIEKIKNIASIHDSSPEDEETENKDRDGGSK